MLGKFAPPTLILVSILLFAGGCAQTKTVEITAFPPDANIRVGDKVRGKGPLTETFTFSGDVERYTVTVEREGYLKYQESISRDDQREKIAITLKPVQRPIAFSVTPLPAIVSINGKRINELPATQVDTTVAFQVDDTGKWSTITATAEREGFEKYVKEIKYEDKQNLYVLDLQAKRKAITISTSPDKADVYINDELRGPSPVRIDAFEVPVDRQTGEFIPQKVRIEKKGYQVVSKEIGWDNGQVVYDYPLEPLKKTVNITTLPKGAIVRIGAKGGVEVPADANGVHSRELVFGPPEADGELKKYACRIVLPNTEEHIWEEQNFQIMWDGGQTDYPIVMKEILVRNVPLLRVALKPADDGAWAVSGQESNSVGFKGTDDGAEANKAVRATEVPKGQVVDSLAVSPDDSQLVYTVLSQVEGRLVSRIVAKRTDGSTETRDLTDGTSLEITPSFTPDGSRIVFSSNRGGRNLSVWSMSTTDDPPAPERQTTIIDTHDLWPVVDANPKPRLFYESYIDTRPGPRVYSTPLGVMMPRDLAPTGGTQPRVAPTADAVLFASPDPKTGKRDIFRMSDDGRDVVNLTNTPEFDEFDAVWSGDGSRVAFVSDRGKAPETPDNYDIWILDAAGGAAPVRVTSNGSWDDCPAWDDAGRSLYFRSNRGGQWNVWRIDLK